MTTVDALFQRQGDRYLPSERTQGPWAVGYQFGGAPAALLAHVVERVPTLAPLMIARMTIDLVRPVPMQPLEVVTSIRREGKKVQLVEASILADGVEVVRASVLRVRSIDLGDVPLPTGQPRPRTAEIPKYFHMGPSTAAVPEATHGTLEYALRQGDRIFQQPTWARLCVPVVEGTTASPIERMAYIADSCSGFGHPRGVDLMGINADITLQIIRPYEGEWLCCEGGGWTSNLGIGVAQVHLSDGLGVVGTVCLTRLVDPN